MRSTFALYYNGSEELHYQNHFLDACFLCQKPLSHNTDIFMYRGDTPFCSQECRQEQIEIDEGKEKRWKKGSSSNTNSNRSSNHNHNNKSKESTKQSDTNKPFRTGTVAVA